MILTPRKQVRQNEKLGVEQANLRGDCQDHPSILISHYLIRSTFHLNNLNYAKPVFFVYNLELHASHSKVQMSLGEVHIVHESDNSESHGLHHVELQEIAFVMIGVVDADDETVPMA